MIVKHGAQLGAQRPERHRARGAQHIFLEVRPTNLAAKALYSRFGFHEVAVRRDYYPAETGREDALVLTLAL